MRLEVKVVARASRNRVAGWLGECLRVTVSAPPERGRANRAAVGLLSEVLGVDVRLLEGACSPRKVFDVPGLDAAAIRERIATRR